MTDLFLADESSIQNSQPRELVKIQQSANVTYYLATGQRDIAWDGQTWTASPATRTNIGVSTAGQDSTPTLTLALTHPFCQRYVKLATPPQLCTVTIYRKQLRSGAVEQIFFGYVTAMTFDSDGATVNQGGSTGGGAGHVGKFALSQRLSRVVRRQLPVLAAGPTCPYLLYGARCRAPEASFTTTTTISAINGNQITVPVTFPAPDPDDTSHTPYTVGGDIRHVGTGEMMSIGAQTDGSGSTVLTLAAPMPDAQIGDAVIVRAGCLHNMEHCVFKFSNWVNFGGFVFMPTGNPSINPLSSIFATS